MPLPPLDHVARALVAGGAREHALVLLEAAARRPGPDRGRCEALLGAMRARPGDSPSGPMVRLDVDLVEALAAAGMLVEARAVARAARIGAEGAVELASALEQVLEEPPEGLAEAARWEAGVAGSLEAIAWLERDLARCEGWLRARVPLAARLLRGFSVHAPTAGGGDDGAALPRLPEGLRVAIAERMAERDLLGALAAARAKRGGEEIVAVLARLVAASERVDCEPPVTGRGTVPLSGHGFVVFQLRMGNLDEAERALRRMVLEHANDDVARERLRDLVALRRAIEPSAEPASTPGWLDKRKAKPTGEGWAPGTKATPVPPKGAWDDDVPTNVLRPEQEAELLLRSGRPERALEIYRIVLARDPARAGVAARVRELEGMLEGGRAPVIVEAPAAEITVQRDVRDLAAAPEARRSYAALPLRADPLAETQDRSVRIARNDGVAVRPIVRVG